MSKLLRCYVSNYGLPDAWYDGLLLDFRDNEKATHTIVNLANGGGKTTLLSFLFSVIDPRKDYFLKSRQQPNHKVSDYFSKDGVPGTCLMEWSAPTTANPLRVYVTGRSVRIKNNNDLEDIMYCYFKDSASGIESFPGPNLGDNEPAMHWDGIMAWLESRRREQGFFKNHVQSSWVERLKEDGIVDSAMIRTQMKFSETEGGVDSFVSFKTQEEFLRKFIELASPEDLLDKIFEEVRDFKQKAENLPKLEQTHCEISKASELLTRLKECHLEWTTQQASVLEATATLIVLREQIVGHCMSVDVQANTLSASIESLQKELHSATSAKESAEKSERYGAALEAWCVYQSNVSRLEVLRKDLAFQELNIKHTQYVLIGNRIGLEQSKREAMEREIGLLLKDQAPLKEALEKAAYALWHSLKHDLSSLASALVLAKRAQASELQRISESKKAMLVSTGQTAQFRTRHADTVLQCSALKLESKRLEDEFAMDIAALPEMLTRRIEGLNDAVEMHARHLQSAERKRYETIHTIAQGEQLHKTLEAQLHRTNEWLTRQVREEAVYTQDTALRGIVDGVPDLSMPSLLNAIDDDIRVQRNAQAKHIAESAKTRERIERLENHRSDQHNANVDVVLRWLHKQGFVQAVSSVEYIASLSPAQRAAVLEKYPQGASGVFVHQEHLSDVRLKMAAGGLPETFQHVWLTTFTGDEAVSANGLYFPLTNDMEYDAAKADMLLSELRAKAKLDGSESIAMESRIVQTQRLRFNVECYQRDFAPTLQEQHARDAEELSRGISDNALSIEEARAQMEHLNVVIAQEQVLLAKAKDAKTWVFSAEKTMRWLNDDFPKIAQLNQSAASFEKQALDAEMETERLSKHLEALEQHLEDLNARVRALDQEIESLSLEQQSISLPVQAAFDKADKDTPFLRSEYQRYLSQWGMASAQHVQASLHVELAACKVLIEQLQKEQLQFVVPDALELGINVVEASALSLERLNQELKTMQSGYQALDVQTRVSEHAYSSHKKIALLEDDQLVEVVTAKERHETQIRDLETATEMQLHSRANLQAAQQKYTDIREMMHRVTKLKDVFEASFQTSAPSNDANVQALDILDLSEWESSRNAALHEYNALSATLSGVKQERDNAYNSYDRYRERYSSNPYLRAQEHKDPAAMFVDGTMDSALTGMQDIMNTLASEIAGHQSDQAVTVGQLTTCTSSLTGMLEEALAQKVPQGAPLIGGMHVLRVKSTKHPFSSISDAECTSRLSNLLDEYLSGAKMFPANSRDLFAQAIVAMYAKPLDFQILKMVENEKERYSYVHQVKNSGAEGVTMAMCLYMTIMSVRNKPDKGAKQRDPGVLLIDNPFAKATSNKFWAALHDLANHYRVQFVFLTAVSDPETLRDFQHYISLTKKLDTVTGRRILTNASITFTKPEALDDSDHDDADVV